MNQKKKVYTFINILKKYWLLLLSGVSASVLSVIAGLMIAYYLKSTVDKAFTLQWNKFINGAYMIFFLILFASITEYISKYCSGILSSYVVYDLRQKTTQHITKLQIQYIESKHSGDILSRLTNDISLIGTFLQGDLFNFIYQILIFIGAFTLALSINWKLTLFSIIVTPLAFFLIQIISGSMASYAKETQEKLGEINSIIEDTIAGIYIVKSYEIDNLLINHLKDKIACYIKESLNVVKRQDFLLSISAVIQILPFVLSIIYGGYLALNKEMTVGSFTAFMLLVNYLAQPPAIILRIIGNIRVSLASVKRVLEILDWPIEPPMEKKNKFQIDKKLSPICFEDVYFSYDGNNYILKNLNFEVKPNSITVIKGESGSGKSTIIKLICGFYKINSGKIKLYGYDLEDWDISEARSLISLVSQDTYLFPTTIEENIRFGRPNATEEEVIEAAKLAYAHEFIMQLPNGYKTKAGERGIFLSGGQRQKISIARAILKNAPILLLDEATSALDPESEGQVQQAIESLMNKCTVLAILHKQSFIKSADEVLILTNGYVLKDSKILS